MSDEMTLVDIFLGAKDRVLDGWCQGHKAEDADGNYQYGDGPLAPFMEGYDPNARKWCLMGAVEGAYGKTLQGPKYRSMMDALAQHGYPGYMSFNDDPQRTQMQVVGMLEDMISYAKELGI